MRDVQLTRRSLLTGTAAVAVGGSVGLATDEAAAKAPFLAAQPEAFYRFRHGKMQITMVSDGPLPLGAPGDAFLGLGKDEITKLLSDNYLSADNIVLEQNCPIVNTGDKLILFETGMGSSKMFGSTTGRLLRNMTAAGISPRDIDAVVCSHAHIDHIGGLVDAKGRKLFPRAQVYISQADFDFWTDDKDPKKLKAFVEHARKNLLPYRDRLVFFKDGQEFLPGITAMSAPGHTVGHTVFMISSNGQTLAAIGDLTHHKILLTERPRTEFAYDTDPKQAVTSRVRVLDMLAAQRIPLLAYHFPWPGYGHVAKQGEGFRYFPTAVELVGVPAKSS